MSLFRSSIGPSPLDSEAVVRRCLGAIQADLEPDPLFRRRLRGSVVNRFVAAREGRLDPSLARGQRMGRLGRACLYATVALAMSVGGVMAAARGAIPGDLLYPVKLEIEALRLRALPAQFDDDLLVYALSERINELSRLADAGNWQAVAALAPQIDARYDELAALGIAADPTDHLFESRMTVLNALLERLPPEAHAAIERALETGEDVNGDASGGEPGQAGNVRDAATLPGRAGRPLPVGIGALDGPAAEAGPQSKPSPTPKVTPVTKPSVPPSAGPGQSVRSNAVDAHPSEDDG